jgi:tRNA U34 5-methylaminomethyl-2-thiouridine-forming methyltransferase MnmC
MQLLITGDGSHTLYVPELDEHYHSTYGAITESLHVFIKSGLEALPAKKNISIFEVGFGTGLNALLACMAAVRLGANISYFALEKNPIDMELIGNLNYATHLSAENNSQEMFMVIHQAPWNETSRIHPGFQLHKIHESLLGYYPGFTYDLVFFDAFGPGKQPEMWNTEIFKRLFDKLNPGGILTTYCVKGDVKRMVKQAGFKIEKLPGPPGKREILRATKD